MVWKARSQAAYHGYCPLVRHRDHFGVEHVGPLGVPHARTYRTRPLVTAVLFEPLLQIEVVKLLAPQHAGQSLAVHASLVVIQGLRRDPPVELVRVGNPALDDLFEAFERVAHRNTSQAQANALAPATGDVEHVVRSGLGPDPIGIDRLLAAGGDTGVEGILGVAGCIGLTPQELRVALVLSEQERGGSVTGQHVAPELMMRGFNRPGPGLSQRGLPVVLAPRPGVPEPERRQHVKLRRFGTAVVNGDADEDVLRPSLRVFKKDIEIPILVEAPVSSSSYSSSSRDRIRLVSRRSR